MSFYQKHVFVCTNRRDPQNPKGSCAQNGADEICQIFKKELADRGLRGMMRANSSGCLDQCAHGPTVVVYPEGIWYSIRTPDDAKEVIEEHLINGRPVERLTIKARK
ncbi:MAG: (2Fe-2S) ferredoxin domain-containing protein [Myxococcales bacterium]|nr:(2Fe-2S) ferredoxin domain-containing protein [Myxococcales bacterium]